MYMYTYAVPYTNTIFQSISVQMCIARILIKKSYMCLHQMRWI